MPLLAQLIATLFGTFFAGLAKDAARKTATLALAAAAILAAGVGLMAVFNSTLAPLAAQAFSTPYGQFLGLAFPPVSGTCIASFIACWMGCGAYRIAIQLTQAAAGA